MDAFIVVMVTAKDEQEALVISRSLVEKELAACCNIVKDVRSVYRWEGKIQDEPEVLMLVKTRKDLFTKVEAEVKRLHSYSTPEIMALDVSSGNAAYLEWIARSTVK